MGNKERTLDPTAIKALEYPAFNWNLRIRAFALLSLPLYFLWVSCYLFKIKKIYFLILTKVCASGCSIGTFALRIIRDSAPRYKAGKHSGSKRNKSNAR